MVAVLSGSLVNMADEAYETVEEDRFSAILEWNH